MFQLICKFFYMNHEWTIEEYDRRRDPAKQVKTKFSNEKYKENSKNENQKWKIKAKQVNTELSN